MNEIHNEIRDSRYPDIYIRECINTAWTTFRVHLIGSDLWFFQVGGRGTPTANCGMYELRGAYLSNSKFMEQQVRGLRFIIEYVERITTPTLFLASDYVEKNHDGSVSHRGAWSGILERAEFKRIWEGPNLRYKSPTHHIALYIYELTELRDYPTMTIKRLANSSHQVVF